MASSGERRGWRAPLGAAALALALALSGTAGVSPARAGAVEQETFAAPEQAVDALLAALRAHSADAVAKVLGPGSRALVRTGDKVADRRAGEKFIAAYEAQHHLAQESDGRTVLDVGTDNWPFPYPIVRQGDRWRFDASAGAQEILDRRIGANELDAIEVCRAYVDAQREYAERDRNHDGFLEYAQKFLSSPGKQDGLYWPAAAGEEDSPMGPLMARARAEGYSTEEKGGHRPYHGYYYRILTGQGTAAPGGAYNYVVKGHMIGGFALVAFPAQYGVSGVMTFIVNHDGVVYEKDLGPDTDALARKMALFNPDPSWTTP